MFIHQVDPLTPREGRETPEKIFRSRRKWLLAAGGGVLAAAAGYGIYSRLQGNDEEVIAAGKWPPEAEAKYAAYFPAPPDPRFEYGRPQTAAAAAARHTNFFEFSSLKWCWKYVGPFQPEPWSISISGLCRNPLKLDLAEFHRRFQSEMVEGIENYPLKDTISCHSHSKFSAAKDFPTLRLRQRHKKLLSLPTRFAKSSLSLFRT